ncbi:PEP-CTERM sorting domain-containing protein [Oceaniferula marina]|uniref:PEP-CTERM sorting domain-containing protein n=1 Tax=Oceaniferula marina TaxID=2748318 RepID=UPI001D03D1BF|nr:PEP-CTERM sorting domain-containing protein [Oceaniferula marina]
MMKMNMKNKPVCISQCVAAAILASSSLAGAALSVTPITNGDFETDLGSTVGSGIANFTQSASDWFEKNGTTKGDALQWDVGNATIPDSANGEVWGLLNVSTIAQTPASSPGAFYQAIGTNEANFDVYVSLDLGIRDNLPFTTVNVNLWSGNVTGADGSSLSGLGATLLDTVTIDDSIFSSGGTVPETVTLSNLNLNTGTSGVAGQTLWLELAAVNPGGIDPSNQALVDNVSVSAIPEPSSTALLGLGGLALILRRRK